MKDFFKPEDFSPIMSNEGLAKVANEKLRKLIEASPLVYGLKTRSNKWAFDQEENHFTNTHTARLMFIEEIKKEPCKHEPSKTRLDFGGIPISICVHCGVELQVAEWREVK